MSSDANASVATTAINLICNTLGGSVLILPEVFNLMSLIPGIVMVLFMGVCSVGSILMIILSAERAQVFTYKELLKLSFPRHGKRLGLAFEFIIFFYTYGVLIEYAKLVAQMMPPAAEDFSGGVKGIYSHEWFWLLLAFPLFWGLTSVKHLAHLRWTSYLGIATIFYVVFLLIVKFLQGTYSNNIDHQIKGSGSGPITPASLGSSSDGETSVRSSSRSGSPPAPRHFSGSLISSDVEYFQIQPQFLSAVPIVSVVFNVLYNVPAYYGELKSRTPLRFYKAVGLALPLCLVVYVVCGMCGYFAFGPARVTHTRGNIMNAFSSEDKAATVGQLGLFLHFCTVFPISAAGCRRCVNQIIFGTPYRPVFPHYVVEAFLLVSTSSILAYLVDGVAIIFEISGSLFATTIVYMCPAVIYIRIRKLHEEKGLPCQQHEDAGEGEGEGCQVNDATEESALTSSTSDERFSPKVVVWTEKLMRPSAWGFIGGGIVLAIASFIVTIVKVSR